MPHHVWWNLSMYQVQAKLTRFHKGDLIQFSFQSCMSLSEYILNSKINWQPMQGS